ncbi:MAG: cytochrome c oxidase subunit 3 [Gemmatimonadota bacterium]
MHTAQITAPGAPSRTGVWIGIATITMSFAAYTSALMVRQGNATDWHRFELPRLLFFNTLLLLASSATLAFARRRIGESWNARAGSDQLARGLAPSELTWLRVTLVLGILFLGGQLLAWRQLTGQGLYLASNPASSFFYVLTVLHALHLLGGIIGLAYADTRLRVPGTRSALSTLGSATLYWHFMDVLWLYLMFLLLVRL